MGQKKLVRKAEPPSKRGIAWPRWTGFRGMTVRDWLQLLIVPVALVVISFLFTVQQDQRQQQTENQRAEAERELASQRAQDEALQAYLDEMSTLLLEKDLRKAEENSEVQTLARARTLTVLERLDSSRKTQALRFLVEANLLEGVEGREPIISLGSNDQRLGGGADLSGANLSFADLSGANLSFADLSDANLHQADLSGADLVGANLVQVDLSLAELPGADLVQADLNGADLTWTGLNMADLRSADLSNAEVSTLNLQGPERPKSLAGATMPNGQKYEDWLKSTTIEFEPGFRFEPGEEWEFANWEGTGQVTMQTGRKSGQLIFTNPRHVFDPTNLSEPKKLPAPKSTEEWVSWLQSHPNLDTSKPLPVSVGGASGKRIDVTVSSTPQNYPRKFCGEQPCVPLYPISDSAGIISIISFEGFKDRFIIVGVGGETVLIDVGARAEKFDEFLPKAQKVLDSVEWKGENSGPS